MFIFLLYIYIYCYSIYTVESKHNPGCLVLLVCIVHVGVKGLILQKNAA